MTYALGPEVTAAWVGGLATILTGAVATGVVVWQIHAQAKLGRRQTQHSEGLQLRLEVYRELTAITRDAENALTELEAHALAVSLSLYSSNSAAKHGASILPPYRVPSTIDIQTTAAKAAIEFITFAERWQFLVKDIKVFRYAFSSANFNLTTANGDFAKALTTLLPVDKVEGSGTFPWNPPSDEEVGAVEAASSQVLKACAEILAFKSDFVNELQRALLGELFTLPIEQRRPLDPESVVVSLAKAPDLITYFEQQTPWGRMCRQTEVDFRRQRGWSDLPK